VKFIETEGSIIYLNVFRIWLTHFRLLL